MSTPWGTAAEEGARALAADLGVKDFVYDPVEVAKGSGRREVSDGLLIAGHRGVILQVKARDPSAEDRPDRARKWAQKKVTEAEGQVVGTRKTMGLQNLELESRRGHLRRLDAGTQFPGVILLDLDPVPENLRPVIDDPQTIVMTLSDWYALNNMVLSTTGVIDYVERVVAAAATVDLGYEATRYHAFADADVQATGGSGFPTLPLTRIDGESRVYAELIGEWIDSDIATSGADPDDVRSAVEILDAIPILGRVQIGEDIARNIRASETCRQPRSASILLNGSMLDVEADRLLIYADVGDSWDPARLDDQLNAHLYAFASVRHEQLQSIHGDGRTLLLSRVGVRGRGVARTFIMMAGDLHELSPPPEIRWAIVSQFGVPTASGVRTVADFGRNEQCPCGSGLKTKRCHHAG